MSELLEKAYYLEMSVLRLLHQAQEEQEIHGEVLATTQEALTQTTRDRDGFVSSLGVWQMRTEAELAALDAKWKPIKEAHEADLAALRNTIAFQDALIRKLLPLREDSQVANDQAYIYYLKKVTAKPISEQAEADTPFEYCKMDPVPDKKKILEALEAGVEVPGWRLEVAWHPQVKPGGPAAMKNAAKRLKEQQKKLAAKPEPKKVEYEPQAGPVVYMDEQWQEVEADT